MLQAERSTEINGDGVVLHGSRKTRASGRLCNSAAAFQLLGKFVSQLKSDAGLAETPGSALIETPVR